MKKAKIMSVFGTRPEAIKMAPLVLELMHREELTSIVCVTAQHREMLDGVMESFGLRADYDLNISEGSRDLFEQTANTITALKDCFIKEKPQLVLVHGDTVSAFSAALAAFYAGIPVGHVEAGLRTYNNQSPYPEEANRAMISRIASLHFAPTEENAENLRREGVSGEIFVTGNTVIDAMRLSSGRTRFLSPELNAIDLDRRIVTLTCHRRENYGEPMRNIFEAVKKLAESEPELTIVYPVHPAPAVRECANEILSGVPNVVLLPPLDVFDMRLLIGKSLFVMTDSGGLQEEAPALGKPVLLLRRETERPEAIKAGTVRLCGTKCEDIFAAASELIHSPEAYAKMSNAENPYGDGSAAKYIADIIVEKMNSPARP